VALKDGGACRYDVYDSEAPAARLLMLKKGEVSWHAGTSQVQYDFAANSSLLSSLLPPEPGSPGRWQLPDDASGLHSTAQMYRTAQLLNSLQVGTWLAAHLLS
jgi:hypothetical protein